MLCYISTYFCFAFKRYSQTPESKHGSIVTLKGYFWYESVSAKQHFALKCVLLKISNNKRKYTLPLQSGRNSNRI